MRPQRSVAVALHDVEPTALARCREIREWLARRGIDRVTLLAIPAPRGTPIRPRCSDLARWLRERTAEGDCVAQHGCSHVQGTRALAARQWLAKRQGGNGAEFVGLDVARTAEALDRGREVLGEAGVEPRGFVAPGYAYTRELRSALGSRYSWWADLLAVRGPGRSRYSPALCLGASTWVKRVSSPALVRSLAAAGGSVMRVDVHPADFDRRRSRAALERLLDRAAARAPVVYDELLA
jgi:predicted deacetylase